MTDDELKAEYQHLSKMKWDKELKIAKNLKARHQNIDFSNPLFDSKLKELEDEMEARGLK